MSAHRTYRGKEFNMSAFVDQNGHVAALGNSGRNARGDVIDKSGNIIATAQQVNAAYNNKNPKAVTKVSITKDTDERLAGQTPVKSQAKPTTTVKTPVKPPVQTAEAITVKKTPIKVKPPEETVVSRKTITTKSGEIKTEITYGDGSVEVV